MGRDRLSFASSPFGNRVRNKSVSRQTSLKEPICQLIKIVRFLRANLRGTDDRIFMGENQKTNE